MLETSRPVPPPKVPRYILLYVLYATIVALGYFVVVHIWPSAIIAMIGASVGRSYANRLIYMLSMLVLGMGMFVGVIAAEPYLRRGMEQRRLLARFARVAVPIALLGLLGWLLMRIGITLMA